MTFNAGNGNHDKQILFRVFFLILLWIFSFYVCNTLGSLKTNVGGILLKSDTCHIFFPFLFFLWLIHSIHPHSFCFHFAEHDLRWYFVTSSSKLLSFFLYSLSPSAGNSSAYFHWKFILEFPLTEHTNGWLFSILGGIHFHHIISFYWLSTVHQLCALWANVHGWA